MEALLFLICIFLFFYAYSISGRVKRLEQNGVASPSVPPRPSAAPLAASPVSAAPLKPATQSNLDVHMTNVTGIQVFTTIGILALLFGLGFFLKYAIDQGWLSELARVALGIVVGGLFVVLGDLWRQRHASYARLLSGGGLAILYFSIFAAYQYYQLLDQSIAGLVLVLITILGVFLAGRYNSKGLMVLALFGGFLSPSMLHGSTDRHVALFVYITILNAGILALLARRFWLELLYVSFIGTVFNFAVWAALGDGTAALHSIVFLMVNTLLITLIPAVLFRKQAENNTLPEHASSHLGAFMVAWGFFFSCATLWTLDVTKEYIAPVFLLGGLISFISYAIVDRLNYSKLNYCMSFVGSVLIASAIGWQFQGKTQDLYFLVASLVGIGVGLKVGRKDLRTWGLILLLVATIKTLTESFTGEYTVFLNTKFGLELLFVIGLLLTGYWYRKTQKEEDETHVPAVAELFAVGLIWFAVSEEIIKYFGDTYSGNIKNLALSMWWIGYAVVLGAISAMRKDAILRKASVVLFGAAIIKVFMYDVQTLDTGYRIVSFIVLGVIILITAFVYQKHKDRIQEFWKGKSNT